MDMGMGMGCRAIRYFLFFFLFSFAFIPHQGWAKEAGSPVGMFQAKPYVTLGLDASGGDIDVLVNGVSVYKNMHHGPHSIKMEVPINKWILPEENNFSIRIFYPKDDPEGEKVDVKMTLKVRQSGAARESSTTVTDLVFNGRTKAKGSRPAGRYDSHQKLTSTEKGDIVVGEVSTGPSAYKPRPGVVVSRSVRLPLSFPKWAFAQSDLIADREQTEMSMEEYKKLLTEVKAGLLPIYQKIHDALETGEVDAILPLFEERNRELALAYYRKVEDQSFEQALAFHAAADGASGELVELHPEDLYVFMSPNRRLIKLANPLGQQAIHFKNSGNGMHLIDDIVFRKSGDKWIITR